MEPAIAGESLQISRCRPFHGLVNLSYDLILGLAPQALCCPLLRRLSNSGMLIGRFLPKPFDGFGIYANYTFTDSEARIAGRSDGPPRDRRDTQETLLSSTKSLGFSDACR